MELTSPVTGPTLTNGIISIIPEYTFGNNTNTLQSVAATVSTTSNGTATVTYTLKDTNGIPATLPGIGPFIIKYTATDTSSSTYIVTTKVAGYDLLADFIFVDTNYPVLVVFPNPLVNTSLLTNKAVFIKDRSWNASVNNVTILATGGARIEDKTSFVLSQNGECLSLFTDLSEYYISSIYPSNNCALMETVDSTNSYNVNYLKAQAIIDRVNVFNTDNTPPFNSDGSINLNPSTTERQKNQNLVILPNQPPTTSIQEGYMCMVIYGGGLSGKRHTYPLAFYSGTGNNPIDGVGSPYKLTNAPCIATGNTSVSVISTTAPNIVSLSSLAGISPLTPIQFNNSVNGVTALTVYYAMYNYNELTDGSNIRLSLTDDGFTPVSNIISTPLTTPATITRNNTTDKFSVLIRSFLDNKLFPGQITFQLQTSEGSSFIGRTVVPDSTIFGLDPFVNYVIDNIVSSYTVGSDTIYTVTLTIGFGGPPANIWSSPSITQTEYLLVDNITLYSVFGAKIPINAIGSGKSLNISQITYNTYTLAISTNATITSNQKGILYSTNSGSNLVIGTGIKFNHNLGDNVLANTQYYIGIGTSSVGTGGTLYVSSSPDGHTLLEVSAPTTSTTGTRVIHTLKLTHSTDINYITVGNTISCSSPTYNNCYKIFYIIDRSQGQLSIVNTDKTPIAITTDDNRDNIIYNSIIIDTVSIPYMFKGALIAFQNAFNGFLQSTDGETNYYVVADSYLEGQSYVPLTSLSSLTINRNGSSINATNNGFTNVPYYGTTPLVVGSGIVFDTSFVDITAFTTYYVGSGTTSVLLGDSYNELRQYTVQLVISTTSDGLNPLTISGSLPDTIIHATLAVTTTNQSPVIATVLNGDSTKSTGAMFISDGTSWYTAGWYDPTNWTWDRTIPSDSGDYYSIPNPPSQFALTISPNVNSFINLPKTLEFPPSTYWSYYNNISNPKRLMPYFIIAKNTSITRSKIGFSTYVQGNSNMFNDNATVRIYWVGSKITKRPCIWFVSEVRQGESHIRYYPMMGYSP